MGNDFEYTSNFSNDEDINFYTDITGDDGNEYFTNSTIKPTRYTSDHTLNEAENKYKPMGSKYDGSESYYNGTKEAMDPLEMQIGMRYEREKDPKGNTDKWFNKVKSNLFKDRSFYTNLSMAGWDESKLPKIEKKRSDIAIEVDKKMSNTTDKNNKMSIPKGIEKVIASAAKAKKETFKPVKGIKDLTHKAVKAKGIKQVMDMTGGKMKKVKALNELSITIPLYKTVDALLKEKFPTLYADKRITLQKGDKYILLKFDYWDPLPLQVINVLKSKFVVKIDDVEGDDDEKNKIAYEIYPKITSEMLNEIKKRLLALFNK